MPTAISHLLLRSGSAHCDLALGGEEEQKEETRRRALIKSNNPYLAGGEKHNFPANRQQSLLGILVLL